MTRRPTAEAVTRGRRIGSGTPRASVSRSAATPASIPRSAARTCSGSAASTTARDHQPGSPSAAGTRPEPVAHRHAATGTRSRPATCPSSSTSRTERTTNTRWRAGARWG